MTEAITTSVSIPNLCVVRAGKMCSCFDFAAATLSTNGVCSPLFVSPFTLSPSASSGQAPPPQAVKSKGVATHSFDLDTVL
jgi:hypothetical protein